MNERKKRKPEYNLANRRKKQAQQKIIKISAIVVVSIALIVFFITAVSAIRAEIARRYTKDGESILYNTTEDSFQGVSSATILSAGDLMLHTPIFASAEYINGDTREYSPIFQYIKEDYEAADFTVLNLECTLAYDNYSSYPLFHVPAEIAPALQANGVDMCLLANNHLYDNKEEGISITMETLSNNNLLFTGIRQAADEPHYLIQNINGISVGFLNYTAETGASSEKKLINDIPVNEETAPLINSFNYNELDTFYSSVQSDVEKMKFMGVEYIIAYLHWGEEYSLSANQQQQDIAQNLCNIGINALIGGHPHVVQPVDVLTSESGEHQMFCAYSLGNHLSNQRRDLMNAMRKGHTEDGLMIQLTIERSEENDIYLTSVDYIPMWVYRSESETESDFTYYLLPVDDVKSITKDTKELDIANELKASSERTNAIISEGAEKVSAALPIS